MRECRAMSKIPEDILHAAKKALDNLLCNDAVSCGGYDGCRKASISDIAEAIVAERERCAAVAEVYPTYSTVTDFDRGYTAARKDAAAEIRKGVSS